MKIRSLMAALLVGSMLVSPAFAASNSQQDKMKACNAQAAGKKGDDRRTFMRSCLSGKPTKMSRQERMKACNTQATGKKGDDRRTFMKSCLSSQPSA